MALATTTFGSQVSQKCSGRVSPYTCRWASGENVHGNDTLWPQTSEIQLNPRLIQSFRAWSPTGLLHCLRTRLFSIQCQSGPTILLRRNQPTYASIIAFWLPNNDFQSDLNPVEKDYQETLSLRRRN